MGLTAIVAFLLPGQRKECTLNERGVQGEQGKKSALVASSPAAVASVTPACQRCRFQARASGAAKVWASGVSSNTPAGASQSGKSQAARPATPPTTTSQAAITLANFRPLAKPRASSRRQTRATPTPFTKSPTITHASSQGRQVGS